MVQFRSHEQITLDDVRSRGAAPIAAASAERRSVAVVPRVVRVRGDFLEWATEAPGQPVTIGAMRDAGIELRPRGTLGEPLLWSFITLYAAGDEAIAAFARRSGVLCVSGRGMPGCDLPTVEYAGETVIDNVTSRLANGVTLSRAGRDRPVQWHREPLPLWRAWSLVIRLLLLYGVELQNTDRRIDPVALVRRWRLDVPPYAEADRWGMPPANWAIYPPDDEAERWRMSEPRMLVSEMCFTATGPDPANDRETTRDEQREVLGWWLDRLADRCALTLRMGWNTGDRPHATIGRSMLSEMSAIFRPDSIFPDIVARLIDVLANAEGVHICPECGKPYPCRRRRGYCPDCRRERKRANARKTWHEHPEYNAHRRRSLHP